MVRPVSMTWPVRITLMACLVLVVAQGQEDTQTITGTANVIEIDFEDKPSVSLLSLTLDSGAVVRASTDAFMFEGVRTGQRVTITGTWAGKPGNVNAASSVSTLEVDSIEIVQPSSDGEEGGASYVKAPATANKVVSVGPKLKGLQSGIEYVSFPPKKTNVKVLFIPIRATEWWGGLCPGSQEIKYNLNDIRWMAMGVGSGEKLTLADAYRQCSYGKTWIDQGASAVADWVTLPCSGTTRFGGWRINGCQFSDIDSWTELVDTEMRNRGYNYNNYDGLVYLLPPTTTCPWIGMGQVGCTTTGCKQWSNGAWWSYPMLYFHEQGHNFNLGHAMRVINGRTDDYGDHSGAMGICCGLRCHNTPHSWVMGWQEVAQFSSTQLGPGSSVTLQMLPQSNPASRGVRIAFDWAPGNDPLFLGFRDRAGVDTQLESDYASRTNIYSAAISGPQDGPNTMWLDGLHDGNRVFQHRSGLTIRHINGSAAGAYINICRYGGPENYQSCCGGMDNDCNGQVGTEDGACRVHMPNCPRDNPSPSPSPPPPSPPPPSPPVTDSKSDPNAAPNDGPSDGTLYTLRQHMSLTARNCGAWERRRKEDYLRAAKWLFGLSNVTMDCQFAGYKGGGNLAKLRIAMLATARRYTWDDIWALANDINSKVLRGLMLRTVRSQSGVLGLLPRRGDGFCVEGYGECPPEEPDL